MLFSLPNDNDKTSSIVQCNKTELVEEYRKRSKPLNDSLLNKFSESAVAVVHATLSFCTFGVRL